MAVDGFLLTAHDVWRIFLTLSVAFFFLIMPFFETFAQMVELTDGDLSEISADGNSGSRSSETEDYLYLIDQNKNREEFDPLRPEIQPDRGVTAVSAQERLTKPVNFGSCIIQRESGLTISRHE